MVIVKLKGGLGNQMFQYAHARALSLEEKKDLVLDLSFYENQQENDVERKYLLNKFNIAEKAATNAEIHEFKRELTILQKLIRKSKIILFPDSFQQEYDKIYRNKKDIYLDGYWQNEKYFANHKEIILNDFKLKEELGKEAAEVQEKILNTKNSTSVHIRRSDYLKKINKTLGTLSLDYYTEAIELIKNKDESSEFFVFSDDISWAKENLKCNPPIHFISNENIKDYEEIILMSNCSNNIIANSSFSWWGAWLNNKSNKTVIAPQTWFTGLAVQPVDIIPNTWIKI